MSWDQNKSCNDTKEIRKGQNYKMKPMWKGNRLRDFY